VIGMRDNPVFPYNPSSCLWVNRDDVTKCAMKGEKVHQDHDPAKQVEEEIDRFYSVDFTPFLCASSICPVYTDNLLMWRDGGHLTASYVRHVSSAIGNVLDDSVPGFQTFGARSANLE